MPSITKFSVLRCLQLTLDSADSDSAKRIPGRLREMRSDSDIAFGRLEGWLKDCTSNHPRCGAAPLTPMLPNRVIDVSVSEREVALVESRGMRGRYLALSHSWGKSSRLMATKETRQDLECGVAISFLPETFQDAVKITRRLGLKYLWIDCLCIMQDDSADWERESAMMDQVYRNSYLTISASSSEDSYSGCFPKRTNEFYISPGTKSLGYETPREAIDFKYPSRPGSQTRIGLFEEWLPGSVSQAPQRTQTGTFGKRVDPIEDQPLSRRGWTLQERLLSPRIIHYATDQMYFECESTILSEDGFEFPDPPFSMNHMLGTQRIKMEEHGMSKANGRSFIVGKHVTSTGLRWGGGWLSLVEDFSKRCLTIGQDKLPALAGVARVIAEETNDVYIAGLWGRHFMEDLYWRVYTQEEYFENDDEGRDRRPVKGKVIGTVSQPAEYRAPSWSWASIDAPVKFNPLNYGNLVAHMEDYHTEPAGADEFGRVSDGRVDLRVRF